MKNMNSHDLGSRSWRIFEHFMQSETYRMRKSIWNQDIVFFTSDRNNRKNVTFFMKSSYNSRFLVDDCISGRWKNLWRILKKYMVMLIQKRWLNKFCNWETCYNCSKLSSSNCLPNILLSKNLILRKPF